MAGIKDNNLKLEKGEIILNNETEHKMSGSELADTNKNIHKFIQTLYGNNPSNGHLVIWTKQDKVSSFYTGAEFEKASEEAEYLSNHSDVYFGVGLQKEEPQNGGRGTKDTVVCIPGLWMDIDIKGPNHKSDNLPPDEESVLKLLESFELEPTLIISTGGGFHVYWLFDEPMDLKGKDARTKAHELSIRFQEVFITLASKNGWEIDNTSSLAQVLRFPGTYNHKQKDPVPVETFKFNDSNRYNLEDIEKALEKYQIDATSQLIGSTDDIPEGSRNMTLTSIAGSLRAEGMDYEQIYKRLIEINEARCKPPVTEEEVNEIAKSISSYEPNKPKKQTQSQRLVNLADNMKLFHTSSNQCYAVVPVGDHKEVLSLQSNGFKIYLSKCFYDRYCSVPNAQGLTNALGVLKGKALYGSGEGQAFIRLAKYQGSIYLDLCNTNWEVVRISSDGWEIINDSPVYFLRSDAMGALPRPVREGKLKELSNFINVKKWHEWILAVSFLFSALNPSGPYPILILQGEQGSAKSTTARILRELIDPSSSPLRTLPRHERDLMISANNNWLLAFDNLSGISPWMSDAFCRLSTGGGLSTRSLYTDSGEVVFDATRPIILNGIGNIGNRNDLVDRSLILNLPRIPKEERKLERELWKDFESVKSRILGALLDAVSCGLKNINNVELQSLPRMADFAQWVIAAEPKLPWKDGKFMEVYNQNRDESAVSIVESDLVAAALINLLTEREEWEGTATELLSALGEYVDDGKQIYSKAWPKRANYLSQHLNRIAPSLRLSGINVDQHPSKGRKLWKFSINTEQSVDEQHFSNLSN